MDQNYLALDIMQSLFRGAFRNYHVNLHWNDCFANVILGSNAGISSACVMGLFVILGLDI
jgi:hypothetical protein